MEISGSCGGGQVVGLFGGTGIVGSHIAYALAAAGFRVRMAYRSEASREHVRRVFSLYGSDSQRFFSSVVWVRADAGEFESACEVARGCHAVIGAAARVGLNGRVEVSDADLCRYNERIATNIVEACLREGVGRLVHIGSISALGSGVGGQPIAEESLPDDVSRLGGYAQSKSAAEREVLRGRAEGLSVCILNPGVILAPPTREGSSADLVQYAAKCHWVYPAGLLAWVDVRDVAEAVMRVLRESTLELRCTLVAAETSYDEFYYVLRGNPAYPRPRFRFSRRLAGWIRVPFFLLKMVGLLPRALKWEVLQSSLSCSRYVCEIARLELRMEFRSLEESRAFIGERSAVSAPF